MSRQAIDDRRVRVLRIAGVFGGIGTIRLRAATALTAVAAAAAAGSAAAEPQGPVLPIAMQSTGAVPAIPSGAPEDATEGAVRISAGSFQPLLVERIDPAAGATGEDAPEGAHPLLDALAALDPEALRVIATMSPDQIDALTLLVLSRQGGTAGGAAGAADGVADQADLQDASLPQDAPWVGDWSDDDIAAADAEIDDAASAPEGELALPGWQLVEARDGAVRLHNASDRVTALTVEAGMVLGQHGRVEDIVRGPDEVLVFLASGAVIRGASNPDVGFRPAARPGAIKAREMATARPVFDGKARRVPGLTVAPVLAGAMSDSAPPDAPVGVPAAAETVTRSAAGAPPPRPATAGAPMPGDPWVVASDSAEMTPEAARERVAIPDDMAPGLMSAGVYGSEHGATEVSRQLVDFEMVPVVVPDRRDGRTVFKVLVDTYQTPIPPSRVAARLVELGYGYLEPDPGTGD
jgi:hypothetical protein